MNLIEESFFLSITRYWLFLKASTNDREKDRIYGGRIGPIVWYSFGYGSTYKSGRLK